MVGLKAWVYDRIEWRLRASRAWCPREDWCLQLIQGLAVILHCSSRDCKVLYYTHTIQYLQIGILILKNVINILLLCKMAPYHYDLEL